MNLSNFPTFCKTFSFLYIFCIFSKIVNGCQHLSHFPLYCLSWNWGHEVYVTKIKSQLNSLMYSKIALKSWRGLKAMKIQISTKLDSLFTPVRAMKKAFKIGSTLCITSSSKALQTGNPKHMSWPIIKWSLQIKINQ